MSILSFLAGTMLFLPQGLYNVSIDEQVSEASVTYEQKEIVQEVPEEPDYSKEWLDGRVSLVGGEITTSERQYMYAQANGIPFMDSDAEYWRNVRSGHFVRLSHPLLNVAARRPHVLPSTATFIYGIVENFNARGCGRLRINAAGRLTTERPRNGSPHSVHPAGMALDLRVNDLNRRCHNILWDLLHESEEALVADSTREWNIPHFHVVVVPKAEVRRAYLVARYKTPNGQDE